MIISASYKTDIPAFYGEWFLNRLEAGYCRVLNHHSGGWRRISLDKDHVDGFVFWTKNLEPFLDKLDVISHRGYPFVVQYAITGYPRSIEPAVISAERAVQHMRQVASRYGPRAAIWRYDTVVLSSETPLDFHRRNFENLAARLEGTTDEVVISFVQMYKKTVVKMNQAAKRFGFEWRDPEDEVKFNLAAILALVAKAHGMQLTMCSQRRFIAPGVGEARCVDAVRLSEIAGHRIEARLKGNRDDCGCYASTDIGEYDTCPHGCVYCYAVRNQSLARTRFRKHDPLAEWLFSPGESGESPSCTLDEAQVQSAWQQRLF